VAGGDWQPAAHSSQGERDPVTDTEAEEARENNNLLDKLPGFCSWIDNGLKKKLGVSFEVLM